MNLPRKPKRWHTYLTHDQVAALAREAGDRGSLILVLSYCGLQWGEAVGLRVKDLDMLRRRINVTVNAVEVGEPDRGWDPEDPQAPVRSLSRRPRSPARSAL